MKVKSLLTAAAGLVGSGVLYTMAPNGDRSRRGRLRPFSSVRIAHRGLFDNRSDHPENSLPAFRRSMEYGFGIELDVRLTKDGIPVVFHDDDLFRACGVKRRVSDLTYEEIIQYTLFDSSETIPLFETVLKEVDGAVPLIIEIKAEYDVIDICQKTMRKLYHYPGLYCIESFSPFVLKWFKEHEPFVLRGQLAMDFFDRENSIEKSWPVKFIAKNLMGNVLSRPDFISYEIKGAESIPMIISRKVFEAKTAAWTIRSKEELEYADQYFDIIIFEGFIPKETEVIK